MIVEERNYSLVPGGVAAYWKEYEAGGREAQERVLGRLAGCFQTEVGELNQIVFLWRYDDQADRERRRAELYRDEAFAAFRGRVKHLIVRQQNRILLPAPFSPL